uniref:LIM and SH3 domain protein 1-like n=1 Tax=Myxine glutinosa TaxID=7769 RepID=UPI00358FDB2B
MNPPCARCKKPTYPMEKLSCLDSVWHKGCFTCEVCNLKLNLKTYKGFSKKPYCNSHYPKQSFTTVADTPENIRLREQSKRQSQVKYKEQFEKERGKCSNAISETPEMERMKKVQEQISNIKYHEDFEKSKKKLGGLSLDDPSMDSMHGYQHSRDSAGYDKVQDSGYYQGEPHHHIPTSPVRQQASTPKNLYQALYDYDAADRDEVSFRVGDVIMEVTAIDQGWMYGTVQRTMQMGMLPANYVEPV